MRFVRTFFLAIVVVTLPFASAMAQEQPPLTPQAIIQMKQIGLSDAIILSTIKAQPGRIPYTVDDLAAMKKAAISDAVVAAMVSHTDAPPPPAVQVVPSPPPTSIAASQNEPRIVEEIGVYYKDRAGKWIAIEPEIVHIKSGGFIKSTVTHGVIKQDRNGHLNGRESKLALQCPIEVLIYVPEGVSANEYDFLRFRINSDNREFRVLIGGVFHSIGGADRDEVKFNPVKTAPHTYQFTVEKDTGGGEYGILPPGTGNVTNGGKIYTFAIVE